MDGDNNLTVGNNTNTPSTSQQNTNNDNFDDANSNASSASTLQMSMLENRLESEMAKLGNMVKDTVAGLTEHVNQKLGETDRKFQNLLADLMPASQNSNVNSSVPTVQTRPSTIPTFQSNCHPLSTVQPSRNNIGSGEPPVQSGSQQTLARSQCKIKPQHFDGSTDFDEFLSQFEITSEINGWQYREKSLYLASCLTGDARSLLSELDRDGQRDYKTLIEKLANRFGSVNRSEIYRTQLKSRTRNKGEAIPELAQAIKKLVRQAYPGVHKDVIETLAIDHFIDALTDSDIRLRVREFDHKTLAEAERSALRLESHKIADRQRNKIVGQIEANTEKNNVKTQWESSPKLSKLQSSLDSLSDQVKDLQKKTSRNAENKTFAKTGKYQQNNAYNGRYGKNNRPHQNNPPPSYGNQQRQTNSQYRNYNSGQTEHYGQSAQNFRSGNRGRQNNQYPARNGPAQFVNNQENWNQSSWRATTRH